MDNIAEGFGRGSKLEFVNALTTAKGEAEELKSQLYRGLDIGYLSETLFAELYTEADTLVRKIAAFISYLNQSHHQRTKVQRTQLTPEQPLTPNHKPSLSQSPLLLPALHILFFKTSE